MVHQHPSDDASENARIAARDARLAIVVSRYHQDVTDRLLQGALATLHEAGIDKSSISVTRVPGAWEIPLVVQEKAASDQFDAVICLGAVIRGETTHDQHINQQVSSSLGALALQFHLPILFGILTCQTLEQAMDRAGGAMGNKGSECARAALEMIGLLREIRAPL